jgi:hypothetical protein
MSWRDSHLKNKYGIGVEEYDDRLAAQKGVCAICGQPEVLTYLGKQKKLAVDHDHSTGKIRGLLCSRCNSGLGCFNDDVEMLTKAIEYLKGN